MRFLETMNFFSLSFLAFLTAVFIVNWAIKIKYRYLWLLGASLFFYASWDLKYTVLLLLVTAFTFGVSKHIYKSKTAGSKNCKGVLAVSIALLIFILLLFKFWTFWITGLHSLFGISDPAEGGLISIIAPIGLSFYSLTAIGYMIDVYRGKVTPENNFGKYALFISFFPNILSGPIERSNHLLPQINAGKEFNYTKVRNGFLLILYGYSVKLLIADRLSVIVDAAFKANTEQTGATMMIAVILYGIQLYADFSGYSCIAVGIGRILGFDLIRNFRQPYFSTSVRDFWNRWHISLSSWLRDYVYIPLGGNRKGKFIQCINLIITFLVSGLWHGTGLQFIVWGALHGFYQVISVLLRPFRPLGKRLKINTDAFSYKLLQGLITFALTDYAWLFFRASSVQEGIGITRNMISNLQLGNTLVNQLYLVGFSAQRFYLLLFETGMMFAVDFLHERKISIVSWLDRQNKAFRWLIYITLIVVILTGLIHDFGLDASVFIYTRF